VLGYEADLEALSPMPSTRGRLQPRGTAVRPDESPEIA
jgi:hypothetical protein